MPRPYSEPVINTTIQVFQYANDVTQGWMTNLFAIACFIVIFMLLKSKYYRTSDSMLVSSLLTLILCSFLWAAGLIAMKVITILFITTIASGIYSALDS